MRTIIMLNTRDLELLVCARLRELLGDIQVEPKDVKIEVKSQGIASRASDEWQPAEFRATFEKVI